MFSVSYIWSVVTSLVGVLFLFLIRRLCMSEGCSVIHVDFE